MTKTSGLGEALYISGVDVSGDIGSLSNVHGGPALFDVTGINKFAHERLGGLIDASLDFVAWFNPAVGAEHDVLSILPTSDVKMMWLLGSTLGSPAAMLNAIQVGYDPTRATDGALSFAVHADANSYGIEWGDLLTAGLRTDTAATTGTSIDGVAASTTGWCAQLQLVSFAGTDVTIKLQDSANNSTWADVSGGAFTLVASGPTTEHITSAAGATLREFVRVTTTTSAGFTSAVYAVAVGRHPSGAAA